MKTAKIFKNGRSQAVRLPKDFRFDGDEVYIKKVNNVVVLMPKTKDVWDLFEQGVRSFSEDFMGERLQPDTEEREAIEE